MFNTSMYEKNASIEQLIDTHTIILVTPSIKVKKNEYKESGLTPIVSQESDLISGYTDCRDPKIGADKYVCFGDHSEHIKYVDFEFVQGADGLKIMKTKQDLLLPKYLYHALSSLYKKGNSYERHFKYLVQTIIPIPPIDVQKKIVQILDSFEELTTELITELTAEHAARKKQYEYYRDNLFSFNYRTPEEMERTKVKWMKVKDVFNRLKGTPITASQMKDLQSSGGDVRIFAGGKTAVWAFENDVPNANIIRIPAILIQSRGIIDVIYYDRPFTFKNEMWAYTSKDNYLLKYFYYYLKNNIQELRDKGSAMGSMPQISIPVTDEMLIPIVSAEYTKQIVTILEKLDKIYSDMSVNLSKEIDERKKQFEYYRNKLLLSPEQSV